MPNTVKINYENLPKGQSVEVPLLGVFPNGATTNVEDFQVDAWEANTGQKFPEGGLEFPTEPGKAAETDAGNESSLQAEIIERQNKRSPEQAAKEEKEAVLAQLRGEPLPGPVIVDGEVIQNNKPAKAKGASK